MKFGLSKYTLDKLYETFHKFPAIEEVILYGSRAMGTYRVGSDIDIALEGDRLTDAHLSSLQDMVEDLNTPYFYDISILTEIDSTSLIEHINRVGKTFYSCRDCEFRNFK